MKKFSEFINEELEEKDTWKDVFCQQVDTGKNWQNLFKNEFEKHEFLDRSDAVYICKKAQVDAYKTVIESLDKNKDKLIINDIQEMIDKLWAEDISALGMYHNGQQVRW